MLTIGDKFPSFDLKAVVATDPKKAFTEINDRSHEGKWKVVFFWPKDFTFVCPTEIAAFGKLNGISTTATRSSTACPPTASSCTSPGGRTIPT